MSQSPMMQMVNKQSTSTNTFQLQTGCLQYGKWQSTSATHKKYKKGEKWKF